MSTIAPSEPVGSEDDQPLPLDKAERIVEAMRKCVARRGTAGSTFARVAREAGVSRGLLHYYFGSKEQLLVEAVRRDCDLRLERLQAELADTKTAAGFVDRMAESLQAALRDEPDFVTVVFEMFTISRRNVEVRTEYAALMRRMREHLAKMLRIAEQDGVLRLRAEPDAVAEVLFSLADGLALRMIAEPGRDYTETLRAASACARTLIAG